MATTKQLGTTDARRGTPCYKAPELQSCQKSDIWALGCIFYELCSKEKAFPNDYDVFKFQASNEEKSVEFLPWIGEAPRQIFGQWIKEMLRVDHTSRPSVEDLGTRFHELVSLVIGTNDPATGDNAYLNKSTPTSLLHHLNYLGTDLIRQRDVNSVRWESVLPPLGLHEDHKVLVKLLKRFVTARKSLLGCQHPKTVWSIVNLAWTQYYIGLENKAEDGFNEALEIMRSMRFELTDMLSVISGISRVRVEQKMYPEACEMWNTLLEAQKEEYGEDHPETLSSMQALAWTLLLSKSNLEIIISELECILEKQRNSPDLGANHPEALTTAMLLASAYNHKNPEKAEMMYSSTLDVLNELEIYGPEHLDTLLCRSGLAWTFVLLGRPHEAIPIFEDILPLQTRIAGSYYAAETKKCLRKAYASLRNRRS